MSKYGQLEDEPEQQQPTSNYNSTKSDVYSKYKIPPDVNICEKHYLAFSIGEDDPSKNEVCPCCGMRVNKLPIAMCDSTVKLKFLGSGYPLFFLFMKCCIVIISAMLAIFGIAALYLNYHGNACTSPQFQDQCYAGYQTLLSFWNVALMNTRATIIQQYLCLAVLLILIFLMQIMRYMLRKTAEECDQQDISASDYTVFVENIPKGLNIDYDQELRRFFEGLTLIDGSKLLVEKVVLAHDIREGPIKDQELNKKMEAKSKAFEEKFKNGSFPAGITEQMLDKDILDAERECNTYIRSFNGNMEKFSGVAFISFKTETMKRVILDSFKFSNWQRFKIAFKDILCSSVDKSGLIFQKQRLFISQAAEPLDVCWENLGISDRERYIRAFLGQLLAFGLIAGTATVLYILNVQLEVLAAKNPDDIMNQMFVKALNVLVSIGIVILNRILSALMPVIVTAEKNRSLAETYGSVCRKLALVLFLSTGFITFLITTFYGDLEYATSAGLIPSLCSVLITNCFLNSFINFLSPGQLMLLYKKSKLRKDSSKWALTQFQANKYWENPDFTMDTVSANMINILQTTCFFALLIPLGLVFSLIFFLANYWIYKLQILKRSTIKIELGHGLCESMTNMMDLVIVFFAISVYVFNKLLVVGAGENQVTIMILVIGIVHFIIPTGTLNKYLFRIENVDEVKHYDEASRLFDTDYELSNPLTKAKQVAESRKII